MDPFEPFDGFHFHHHLAFHEEVESIAAIQCLTAVHAG